MYRFLTRVLTISLILAMSHVGPVFAALLGQASGRDVPPGAFGFISERFQASPDRKVILIQDLHAHLDTQRKIVALLTFYESQGLLQNPIAIEGASGVWDLSLLESYPQAARRSELFDYLLKEAGLTGPEWFALNSHRPKLLYGVDHPLDFTAQRELFTQTRAAREIAAKQMNEVQQSLDHLAKQTFKGKLRTWKKLSGQFERGKLYDDVFLRKISALGSGIRLPTEASSYSEARKYGQTVGIALSRTPQEANLVKALYASDLIGRLLRQQISLEEIRQIASRQQELAQWVHSLIQVSGQTSWFDASALLELLRAATDFYVAALVRDEPLARNTIQLLDKPGTVILIAGGFHTAGVTHELKKQGVSYDVVTPNITAEYTPEDEVRYADRLAGIPVDLSGFPGLTPSSQPDANIRSSQGHSLNALLSVFQKIRIPLNREFVSMFEHQPAFRAWRDRLYRDQDQGRKLENTMLLMGFEASRTLTLERNSEGRFAVSGGDVPPFLLALRDWGNLFQAQPNRHPRVRKVHLLTGPILEFPHLAAEHTLDDMAGVLIIREELPSGGYALWLHENSLERARPYLLGPLSSPLSRALLIDTILFHEHTQQHNDERMQKTLVTHDDLVQYGADLDRVVDSLRKGTPNAFLDRVKTDLGIDRQTISLLGVESLTGEEYGRFLRESRSVVDRLDGNGLNEADKQLMTLFYKASRPRDKQRLLEIRELLFQRGRVLAEKGIAETGMTPKNSGQFQTAAEAAVRLRSNLERWQQWALAYATAYIHDHPNADAENVGIVGKSVVDEIEQDIYQPLLKTVVEMEYLARQGQIDPNGVTLRLNRTAPDPKRTTRGRSARVGFLPMKGDPWQVGHIFVMLQAIVTAQLDKVVIMVDNSDPERKPQLSSLTVREPITLELLKVLEPFVEYTPIAKEEEDLRKADGETALFRLMQFNRHVPVDWFYMVGSDHRRWEIEREGERFPDTAKKLHSHKHVKLDGYSGENLGIIFIEREGEEFQEGEIDTLRIKSGIESISRIHQPMDTSSSRVRKDKHWWTVPYDAFAMGESFNFWGAAEASQVPRGSAGAPSESIQNSRRLIATAMANLGSVMGFVSVLGLTATVFLPSMGLAWSIPQMAKFLGHGDASFENGRIHGAQAQYQRLHEISHVLTRNELAVELIWTPLLFWANLFAGVSGFIVGFLRGSAEMDPLMKARVQALDRFIRSGQTYIPDITGLSPAPSLSKPSQFFDQIFSYLNVVHHRERQDVYERARKLMGSAA